MDNTVVFDLDGTIANVNHRRHFVSGKSKDFDKFYEACVYDLPNGWAVRLINSLIDTGHHVVIVSARPTTLSQRTTSWLSANGVSQKAELFLLRDEEHKSTQDAELKRLWLNAYGKHKILFVVDDRQRVVDMWRSEGMVCLQCDKWEEN